VKHHIGLNLPLGARMKNSGEIAGARPRRGIKTQRVATDIVKTFAQAFRQQALTQDGIDLVRVGADLHGLNLAILPINEACGRLLNLRPGRTHGCAAHQSGAVAADPRYQLKMNNIALLQRCLTQMAVQKVPATSG
jgi:hypothetical protein